MPSPRITVRLDDDRLAAFVDLVPGAAEDVSALHDALRDAGVTAGLDEAAIDALAERLRSPEGSVQGASVAIGCAPSHGDDAWLEPAFDGDPAPGRLRSDGSLDFRERDLVTQVREGDAVAQWHEATAGVDGRGVDGGRLPATPGKDLDPPLGAGVTLDASGTVHATRRGAVRFAEDDTLEVVDVLIHQGDVDLHSGNLSIDGCLQITGCVRTTMCVRATRDLEIGGALEGGRANAGDRLQLGGGARPGSSGSAGSALFVTQVHGARLRSKGLLEVGAESLDGNLAAKQVTVERRVVGGQVVAEERIRVGDAGTPAGGPVTLRAAEPLLDPRESPRDATSPPRSRRDGRGRVGAGRDARARSRDEARRRDADLRRLREWRRRQRDLAKRAYIDVTGRLHPGVTIEIGTARHAVESPVSATRFRLDPKTGRIVEETLQP